LHDTKVKEGVDVCTAEPHLRHPQQKQHIYSISENSCLMGPNLTLPHENAACAVNCTAIWVNLAAVFESEKSNIQWQK